MAGLIGLAYGGATGMLAKHFADKQQNEQMHQMFQMKSYMDAMHEDPTVINNPEFVKGFKKLYGDGADDFIVSQKPRAAAAMREQQQQKDIMNLVQGVGIGTKIGGGGLPAQAPKQFNQAQDVVRGGAMPGQLPSTSIQGPGLPPSMPQQQPAPAPAAAQAAPAPTGTDALDAEQKQLETAQLALGQLKGASPQTLKSYQSVIAQHLKDIEERRKTAMRPIEAAAQERAKKEVDLDPSIQGRERDALVKKVQATEGVKMGYAKSMADYHEAVSEKLAKFKGEGKTQQKATLVQTTIKDLGKERVSLVGKMNDPKFDQGVREANVATFNDTVDQTAAQFDDPKHQEAIRQLKIQVGSATPGTLYGSTPGAVGANTAFKAGDKRVKDGVTYQRDDQGKWTPVK